MCQLHFYIKVWVRIQKENIMALFSSMLKLQLVRIQTGMMRSVLRPKSFTGLLVLFLCADFKNNVKIFSKINGYIKCESKPPNFACKIK